MHFLYMIMVKIIMKGPHPKEYGHINQINVLTLNSICFLYATFKAEKEWSFNGSFSIGGQCGVDVGCVNLGINISSIDLVGIDWDWGKGKVDTYHCEENNARGTRGVSLGLFTLAGQTYEGGDYFDEASKRTNVLGVGVGQSKGQWNNTLGVTAILGIQISISSKIKK